MLSDFDSRFFTHFSLIYLAISFRFVFFCLLSSLKNTYRVFSDFDSCFYTHFSLIYLPISFRFVFFCLLSSSKKHTVCFLTSILAFSHTFPFSTWQSASGLCFSACFSLKKQLSKYVRQTYNFPVLILLIIRHAQQFIHGRCAIFHKFKCTLLQSAHALFLYSIFLDILNGSALRNHLTHLLVNH